MAIGAKISVDDLGKYVNKKDAGKYVTGDFVSTSNNIRITRGLNTRITRITNPVRITRQGFFLRNRIAMNVINNA